MKNRPRRVVRDHLPIERDMLDHGLDLAGRSGFRMEVARGVDQDGMSELIDAALLPFVSRLRPVVVGEEEGRERVMILSPTR